MYGDGDKHAGLDGELASKIILKTHKFINESIVSQPEFNGRGLIGELSDPNAPVPVVSTAVIV